MTTSHHRTQTITRLEQISQDLFYGYQLSLLKFKISVVRTKLGVWWLFFPYFLHVLSIGLTFTYIWKDPDFLPFFTFSYLLWRAFIDPVSDLAHFWRSNVDPIWSAGSSRTLLLTAEFLSSLYKLLLYILATIIFSKLFLNLTPVSPTGFIIATILLRIMGTAVAVGWSFMTARFFDLTEMTATIILLAYLMSPIFWNPDRISENNQIVLLINPVFHIMEFGRSFVFNQPHQLFSYTNFFLLFSISVFISYISFNICSRRVVVWVL